MKIAMGELGWPPSEAYWCDVNAILLAREGQTDLLCRVGLLRRENAPPDLARPPRDARGRAVTFEDAFDRRYSANHENPAARRPRRLN